MIWDYPMWFYLPVFVYLNFNVMKNVILFFVIKMNINFCL